MIVHPYDKAIKSSAKSNWDALLQTLPIKSKK
jgi:hypothetical protein